MRFLVKLVVLGFAGLGMYRAWELVGPKVSEARQRASGARERIEPAIREAADTLQTATKDAAEELADGTRGVVDEIAPDAFGSAAEKVSPTPKLAP
jgi:hypothetical protein